MASIPFALPSELPPDEDHRVALEAVYWSECSVATIFIILRFWARILKHSLGLDDVFMAVCYVSASFSTLLQGATERTL